MRVFKGMILAGAGALILGASACADKEDPYTVDRASMKPAYEADNTGRNAQNPNAPTPLDQGTSEADVTVTREIRQALMDESALSMTAKNVKVITREGKVTLRGPVAGADERSRIEAIAVRIAGMGNVTNQLELDTPKS